MSFTHSLKWSFLAELANKLVTPVVFVVLARLLAPEDFGVMSAALMVIAFSQIFWEAGMGKALIQRQSALEQAANAAFWINIGLGCVIAAILFLVAEPVANTFFQDPRVTAVLQVMTLQVLLGAAASVHTALLQKEMAFKKLFRVRFATVSLPGLLSIPLAWGGMGYWALVAGALAGQAIQVLTLWNMAGWRPAWTFNTGVAKEMGRFGAWVAASGLLAWFYLWADALIVGMYLGSHELGLYRTGNQFAMMIFALMFGPVLPVLYSHLARMNQDARRLKNATEKVVKVAIIVSIPVALTVYSLSHQIGVVVFGETWQGIGLVIGVMALTHGFAWIVGMNGEVYRALGKPVYETIVPAVTLLIYLGGYVYAIRLGFEQFVWMRFILAIVGSALHLYVLRRLLGIALVPILFYLGSVTAGVLLLVYAAHWLSAGYAGTPATQLIVAGILNVALVAAAILLIERNRTVREVMELMRGRAA